MDATVNDFLNEINEIAPLNENKDESVWEKCFDEDSGYYYYWNTKTNEVTWDMPPEYKSSNKSKTKKTCNLYIPPRSAPLFPSASSLMPPVSDAIKIYKIGECTDTVAGTGLKTNKQEVVPSHSQKQKTKKVHSKPYRKNSDSEDEKIVLISSYGDDTESEEEEQEVVKGDKLMNGSKSASKIEDQKDAALPQSQKIPPEVKKLPDRSEVVMKKSENKAASGLSLVAGYSDSEEEPEPESEIPKTNFLIGPPPQENKISHSTLFPVTKPIDVKDFEEPRTRMEETSNFDSKAFQRKRRIGVALINTGKKTKTEDNGERKGLGFNSESTNDNIGVTEGSTYPGFKSGGVMFVKADVLKPTCSSEGSQEKIEILREVEDTYITLKEKLSFLSEGRDEVSPVQVMLIQIEILFTALKSGNLKQSYLKQWLDEQCSELVTLEKETTPEGWLLQWDSCSPKDVVYYFRTHKRYYYQNASTGESQWEYPQADVTVCDEAMDICTTPPPNGTESTFHMSPPLPPTITSPSPPPPPSISDCKPNKKSKCDIPLPPETKEGDSNEEPLPPGVDGPDIAAKSKDVKNDMTDVLNSFYSDIAAIETSNSPPVSSVTDDPQIEPTGQNVQEPVKKKKKTKVKLAQGIAMKKKGVSKLVEKWKNVQLSYND